MRLWITGYRSYELGIFNDNDPKVAVIKYCLENNLNSLLEKGLEWVITGGQLGTEQWALEVAEKIAMTNFELKTSLMYPFSEFGSNWKEDKKIKLKELEENCDFSAKVSSPPRGSCRRQATERVRSAHPLYLLCARPSLPSMISFAAASRSG